MASGSRPTRKRTSVDRKGKRTTTSDEAPPRRLPSIEHVLNQTCFFSQRDQMIKYGNEFYQRVVLAPKLMDFQYFATSGLYFHHHLEFQGLQHYVSMSCSYYEDLTKVFYSNLRVSQAGHLYSEVNKTKIKMKSADWLIVAGLKYQGHKLSFTNIPEGIDYDRDTALASMIRQEMQGRNVRNAGSLNINDRLLHYVYVHILAPRSSNFAQLLQEDIFMLWAIKNNMLINWPHFIMEHMIKCRDNDMHLPYAILITKIMSHFGVDLSIDAAVDLGWNHCFYKKTLKKLNVVYVDGVWQHGMVNQDHGQNDEHQDQPIPEEHVNIFESPTTPHEIIFRTTPRRHCPNADHLTRQYLMQSGRRGVKGWMIDERDVSHHVLSFGISLFSFYGNFHYFATLQPKRVITLSRHHTLPEPSHSPGATASSPPPSFPSSSVPVAASVTFSLLPTIGSTSPSTTSTVSVKLGHHFTSTTINLGVIEVFKEICKKNKDNRNKQVIPHTGGSKPISRRSHEMYTNLESQVQTTLGALKAYMIMKEGKIPDELAVFFDPQPQVDPS
ncbi:hypothetical protein Fmac_031910 [Flemingia macrophylla]|uniref:Putative plant transposon protein domain-containing protein n=1 Tax=Flemingia macrophylla TaxID=520843 RepID=A0ABD1L3E1_9FABA